MKRIIITVSVLGALAYLGYTWWKKYSFTDKFEIKPSGHYFRINGLHSGEFEIYLDVTSKYPFNVNVTGYNLNVMVNGTQISNLRSGIIQTLISNTPSRLTLKANFDPAVLVKNVFDLSFLRSLIADKMNTKITIQGTISISAKNIAVNDLPMDMTMTLAELTAPNTNSNNA